MVNSSLVNLGISCFIKAGLEAMLATPTLREELLQGASGMEMALSELCHNLQTSEQPLKPTKSTDKFYREDDRRTWPSFWFGCSTTVPVLPNSWWKGNAGAAMHTLQLQTMSRRGTNLRDLPTKICALPTKICALPRKICALPTKICALPTKIGALPTTIRALPKKVIRV